MISLSLRALINLESLNGVESVGNLSRHRIAPMVVRGKDNSYNVRYVPVISGESIGHGYQEALVKECEQLGLPVGERSKRCEFVKFAEKSYFDNSMGPLEEPKKPDEARAFEVKVILRDTVADIGGFLYTGKIPVKRSSRIQCGYMIPAADAIESAALEAQFHVRHVPSQLRESISSQQTKEASNEAAPAAVLGQIHYSVEVGSALYTMSIVLDIEQIGKPSTQYGKKVPEEKTLDEQIERRQKASLLALEQLLSSFSFGARKGRFLPNMEILSAVADVSKPNLFVVSPGNSRDYIRDSYERAVHFERLARNLGSTKQEVHLVSYIKETAPKIDEVEQVGSIEELVERLTELQGLTS
ncbi:MAG: type I-A CRISPR-associated protein Cas7/Csa2 [Conexivisphaerales archaeon]